MSKPVNPLIVTHASVELAALPGEGSTAAWNRLVPSGTFTARDGRGPFHAGSHAEMAAILARTRTYAGSVELVVDYDHQSFTSAVKGVGGTARAAGWIKDFDIRADGIWGLIEWTSAAALAIKSGEYRYLSPSFQNDKAGRIHAILNAGLVNMPAMDLVAIAASIDHSLNPPETTLNPIAKALGLPEDADEAAILAAINAQSSDRARVLTSAGLKPGATTDELVTTLAAALSATEPNPALFVPIALVTALQNEVTSLKNSVIGDKAETEVAKAISDGKLAPALRTWAINLFKADPVQFATFIGAAPVLTSSQMSAQLVLPAADALTETDEKMIQLMGLDRAAFIANRKKETV